MRCWRSFTLDQVMGEGRGIDGGVQFAQDVRERAGVVFMPVGDENSPHALRIGS